MKKFFYYILFLSLIWAGCNESPASSAGQDCADLLAAAKNDNIRAPLCIVFCDFTTSIDSVSTGKITKDADDIFKALYGSYNLRFYAVDDEDYSPPFFSWEPVLIKEIKPSEEDMLKNCYKMRVPEEEQKLLDNIRHLSKTNRLGRSCMINAVKKAIREFDNYDSSDNIPLKLVFLSDMLERCTCSLGNFNLENRQFIPARTQLSQATIPPGLSLGKFRSLDVEIVISSNKPTNGSDLDDFWSELFRKFGYTRLKHLSSSMPPALTDVSHVVN